MKFFWRVFFSTMFISIGCFSLGTYCLIAINSENQINQEVEMAYQLGDMIHYSLQSEVAIDLQRIGVYKDLWTNGEYDKYEQRWIGRIAKGMAANTINGVIRFRISSQKGEVIFSSMVTQFDNGLLEAIQEDRGYALKQDEGRTYIQVARATRLLDKLYYIEIIRDITHIFDNQQLQYTIFARIIVGILVIGGALTALIAKMLMIPIDQLTQATTEISNGNFKEKIVMKGSEEFIILAVRFNEMACNLEQKIQELKNEIEKKELFVGAFSHELKTPLTSIIGYSDMLRSKKMSEENVALCANYIFTEGKRLEVLSMRLLELIVLKQLEIKLKPVSVEGLVEEINVLMAPVLQENQIRLVKNIEPSIIWIEEELMKTVLMNLIDNGRKAIKDQGIIFISGQLTKDGYSLCIKDNGRGMEAEELNKITQAFYTVDASRSREEGGVGLGLAICEVILNLHKAKIEFESIPNRGTSVTIQLKGNTRDE